MRLRKESVGVKKNGDTHLAMFFVDRVFWCQAKPVPIFQQSAEELRTKAAIITVRSRTHDAAEVAFFRNVAVDCDFNSMAMTGSTEPKVGWTGLQPL